MSKDAKLPDGRVLIVGLGNPGAEYDRTRHNIGFRVVEALADRWQLAIRDRQFKALVGAGTVAGRQCVVIEPQTYMNLSGQSVSQALSFYKLTPASVIVAHDDIDLPVGRVRLKLGGGHGGHNGLRSLDQQLPTNAYLRVRLGVGRPPHPAADVAAWVLGRFGSSEQRAVDHLSDVGAEAIERLLRDGLLAAQGVIHPLEPPR